MKRNKVIVILILIIILLIGIIYNLISINILNNQKLTLKEKSETEYESNITSLNQSHTDYANYIQESKTKIASAITDMGINTSNQETLETMAVNIRSIARDASSISYDNSSSMLAATNVQEAINELNDSLGENAEGLTIHEKLDYIMSHNNKYVTINTTELGYWGTQTIDTGLDDITAFYMIIDGYYYDYQVLNFLDKYSYGTNYITKENGKINITYSASGDFNCGNGTGTITIFAI